jgi:hypothetical protein
MSTFIIYNYNYVGKSIEKDKVKLEGINNYQQSNKGAILANE